MTVRCPHCSSELQQLGRNEDSGRVGEKVWVGENLYRCQECKHGSNRFIAHEGVVVPWLT